MRSLKVKSHIEEEREKNKEEKERRMKKRRQNFANRSLK
jgi:hypothetical protein